MAKSFKTAKTIKLFLDECDELLGELNQDLVELERGDVSAELMQRICRCVHTLKGSSAMLEFMDISEISHSIEDVIDVFKTKMPEVDKDLLDDIFQKVDSIGAVMGKIRDGSYGEGQAGGDAPAAKSAAPPPQPAQPPPPPPKEPEPAVVAERQAPTPQAPPSPAADAKPAVKIKGRTNLFEIFGPPIRPVLERCFPVFSDIESKYVLLSDENLKDNAGLFKNLLDNADYLYCSLVCMAEPVINEIMMRTRTLLSRVVNGEIPRGNNIFEIVFTAASTVKALVENLTSEKPAGDTVDTGFVIGRIESAMAGLMDQRDYVTPASALEIFQRLDVNREAATLLTDYEKHTIARTLIDGLNLIHFELKFDGAQVDDLPSLSDFFKPLTAAGMLLGSIVWHSEAAQGKDRKYHYHLLYGTQMSFKEMEADNQYLKKLDNLTMSQIGISIDRKESKGGAPRAAQAAKAEPAARAADAKAAPRKEQPKAGGKKTDASAPTVRVDAGKLDELVNFIGELVINHNKMEEEIKALKQSINRLGDMLDNLKTVRKASDLTGQNITLEDLLEPFKALSGPDILGGARMPQQLTGDGVAGLRTIQDNLLHLFDMELEKDQVIGTTLADLSKMKGEMDALYAEFQNDGLNIGRVIVDLQDETMKLRMLPISSVFNKFPRRVRDIAKQLGKKIEFTMEGEDTELDKTLIEEIEEPLLHIIRNALDHGIERSEDRSAAGKAETGTIHARASHEGNSVVIEVSDDGQGIDPQKLKDKCIEKRLISREEAEAMSEREAMNLIFIPGFSTASEVSDLSGRGVGMDVVKNSIAKLKGMVDVFSEVGTGTRFKLKLPLTLAIIQAMIVKSHGQKFVIPMDPIESTERLSSYDVSCVDGKEVFRYQEMIIPVMKLRDVFNIPDERDEQTSHPVVVVAQGEKKIGIIVDEVIEKQQVVIKNLGEFLGDIKYMSGATIFGDGSVALIIDVGGVVNSVSYISRKAERRDARAQHTSDKSILLVDDSISGRIAQREMLERMGFRVDVASSGMQALAKLGDQQYDMVVTDINMPRMDGYELTVKIRAMESARRMPIIMVTSDVKKADRNKAYECGVNDFLAKPFSEEELRATIEKHLRIY